MSARIPPGATPSNAFWVAFIPLISSGNTIGKAKTGNNAFLEPALANSADIIVAAEAKPKEEIDEINNKELTEFTLTGLIKKKKNPIENKLIAKLNNELYANFPKNTASDFAVNCKRKLVPRSSSEIKIFANPVIAEKNMIIQSKPAETGFDNTSPWQANAAMVTVTTMKRATAEIEERSLNSLFSSFKNTA